METEDGAQAHNAIFLKDKEAKSNAICAGNKVETIIPSEVRETEREVLHDTPSR